MPGDFSLALSLYPAACFNKSSHIAHISSCHYILPDSNATLRHFRGKSPRHPSRAALQRLPPSTSPSMVQVCLPLPVVLTATFRARGRKPCVFWRAGGRSRLLSGERWALAPRFRKCNPGRENRGARGAAPGARPIQPKTICAVGSTGPCSILGATRTYGHLAGGSGWFLWPFVI